MSYVLVYSVGGHELSEGPVDSIDAVNAEIRKLYDETRPATITILRIEEAHDGPRTWAIEYPPAPPAGTRVADSSGSGYVWRIDGDGRSESAGGTSYSWKGLLEQFGPLTEVVETEVEAAARRLREADFAKNVLLGGWYADDIKIVLAHVLNGGQL